LSARSILLVEDNPDDESLTLRGLRKAGWGEHVAVARDGASAMEILRGLPRQPDLVLLDLKLPKFDGIEVLRQIRGDELTRRLCVVVFTSSSEPRDISRCYGLGCNSYLIKPVAYENYISTMEQICSYWLSFNTAPSVHG